MSRTLHKRPVDGMAPLSQRDKRYWDREYAMETRRYRQHQKQKQQFQELQQPDEDD